jgi:hypothetical protein
LHGLTTSVSGGILATNLQPGLFLCFFAQTNAMKKQYSSLNAETLRSLLAQLNKAGIFPFGFTTKFAEETGLALTSIRAALKGQSAAIETQEALINRAEEMTSVIATRPKPLDFSHLNVAELIEQRLLPTGYLEQAAKIAGTTVNAVGWFSKNQREGANRYEATKPIEKALLQLAGYNKERELIYRAERILEHLSRQA